jgi:hypothetical protein
MDVKSNRGSTSEHGPLYVSAGFARHCQFTGDLDKRTVDGDTMRSVMISDLIFQDDNDRFSISFGRRSVRYTQVILPLWNLRLGATGSSAEKLPVLTLKSRGPRKRSSRKPGIADDGSANITLDSCSPMSLMLYEISSAKFLVTGNDLCS